MCRRTVHNDLGDWVHKRIIITTLLLLVLAVRSLLPVGYMLQSPGVPSGSFEIVICTSAGMKLLSIHDSGSPEQPEPDVQRVDHGLCPFAASAIMTAATELPRLAVEVVYAAVAYSAAVAQFAETPRPRATSARGPPTELV